MVNNKSSRSYNFDSFEVPQIPQNIYCHGTVIIRSGITKVVTGKVVILCQYTLIKQSSILLNSQLV